MSELFDEVREALTELAAEESYQKLKDPEYMKFIVSLTKDIAFTLAEEEADEDDVDDSDVEELKEIILKEIEKLFSTDEQLREFAFQIAANRYVTKNEAKAYLDGYLAALGPDREIEPQQLKKLKEAHKIFLNECKNAYDFVDELLSTFIGIVKREGIEKAVTIERRNSVIRAIIPTAEEYIAIFTSSWQAAKDFFDRIQEVLFEDPETQEIGKNMFDAIKNTVESISEDILKHETDKIY